MSKFIGIKNLLALHNYRIGLATNSSSSHSLIWLRNVSRASDFQYKEKDGSIPHHPFEYVSGEYGWDNFTLRSYNEKSMYLAVMLCVNMDILGYSHAERLMLLGKIFPQYLVINKDDRNLVEFADDYGIDHQSMIYFPTKYHDRNHIDEDFFMAFQHMVLNPHIVILGGNDNDDEVHPLAVHGDVVSDFRFPSMFYETRGWSARYDKERDYWMLFNSRYGEKIRFSFTDVSNVDDGEADWQGIKPLSSISPEKAFAPELVDIKINSYCPYGCPMCYMGSTENDTHGDIRYIKRLADVLSYLEVPEVAIGGGEPTLHPDFLEIITYVRSKGIIPNFTTKNLTWLKDDKIRNIVMDNCGAFAVSVDSVSQINKLAGCLNEYQIDFDRANLHFVMGMMTQCDFEEMMQKASEHYLRVTLLGYKDVGRGKDFEKINYDWWLSSILKLREINKMPSTSIDTTLAASYSQKLLDSGIPSWVYHTVDGKFSAYVNADNETMNSASYVEMYADTLAFDYSDDITADVTLFLTNYQKY